ncbi:MAG: dTMP kinase [Acidimicrobiaceae bacterium]|nr:dTMP kinase [Acidimicrobiaceae bacterium]MXW75335.1 dTMP kinase [Acidimicrobiaceae bacterium]MYC41704.1 dTMP kinase [Acidimicrobiaceae bacterium]MYD06948.1 dTMP kinase [Acidimicrobiaceae bacterium]MYH87306.1 dTMP kinase [Acidimicrobiaceae bacterium]
MTGRLIVFEGVDGSGKSTQVRRLAQRHDFDVTFQFGATDVGSAIRSILLDPDNARLDDRTEALLIIADKAQHVSEIVRPALADGRTVISDRYRASTLAYQGYGRGLDLQLLDAMMHFATQGLEPDLTVLLDFDVATALERLGDQRDRIERAGTEFYQRVRDGYLELAAQHPDSWVVVDANGSVDEVAADIETEVDDWLVANS